MKTLGDQIAHCRWTNTFEDDAAVAEKDEGADVDDEGSREAQFDFLGPGWSHYPQTGRKVCPHREDPGDTLSPVSRPISCITPFHDMLHGNTRHGTNGSNDPAWTVQTDPHSTNGQTNFWALPPPALKMASMGLIDDELQLAVEQNKHIWQLQQYANNVTVQPVPRVDTRFTWTQELEKSLMIGSDNWESDSSLWTSLKTSPPSKSCLKLLVSLHFDGRTLLSELPPPQYRNWWNKGQQANLTFSQE